MKKQRQERRVTCCGCWGGTARGGTCSSVQRLLGCDGGRRWGHLDLPSCRNGLMSPQVTAELLRLEMLVFASQLQNFTQNGGWQLWGEEVTQRVLGNGFGKNVGLSKNTMMITTCSTAACDNKCLGNTVRIEALSACCKSPHQITDVSHVD